MFDGRNTDVIDFATKHLSPYMVNGDEIVPELCPFCGGGRRRDRNTFAINMYDGGFNCKRGSCAVKGGFAALAQHFGEKAGTTFSNRRGIRLDNREKTYTLPQLELLPLTDQIIDYFDVRKISRGTLEKYRVAASEDGNIVFPFYNKDKLIYVKHRHPWKPREGERKEWAERNTQPILFGMDECSFNYPLVLTEGMLDSLSLIEAGIPNAVSVPSGVSNFDWVNPCWDFLEKFNKIILFGDNDEPGREMVETLIMRLGEDRCYTIVEYPERPDGQTCKDANEILYFLGAEPLRRMVEEAEPVPVKGLIDLGDVVPIDPTNVPRIRIGIKGLDEAVGGLHEGDVIVLTGRSGEGKLLADDTPVLTKQGWKTHGDLVVGDFVLGKDMEFVRVEAVGLKDFADVAVAFKSGERIYSHKKHEWPVLAKRENGKHITVILETQDLMPGDLIVDDMFGHREVMFKANSKMQLGNCIQVQGGIYRVGRSLIPTHNSTLSGSVLLNAIEQGKVVCAYSGELSKEKFQAWINLQCAGSEYITIKHDPIRGRPVPFLTPQVQERIRDWYRGKFFLFDNTEVFETDEQTSILKTFSVAARRYGASVFLVDNLMTSVADSDDELKAQGAFVTQLKKFAKRFKASIILVAHPRKTKAGESLRKDDVSGNSAIVNLCDTGISVERPDLRIIKNREDGIERLIECAYAQDSRRIFQADTGDTTVYSWDKTGVPLAEPRADSFPEFGIQLAENRTAVAPF